MRQRINARNRQGKVRIVLIGKTEAHSLDTEAKLSSVAVKWLRCKGGRQQGQLFRTQNWLVDTVRAKPLPDELDRRSHRQCDNYLDGLGKERTQNGHVRLKFVNLHYFASLWTKMTD